MKEAQTRYANAVAQYSTVASDEAIRALGRWNDFVKGVANSKDNK